MVTKINVDKDIRLAETLPAKFYKDENLFDKSKKKIFLRSWHWIGDDNLLKEKNTIVPYNILPEFLDEPILVSCSEDDKLRCFSNVCKNSLKYSGGSPPIQIRWTFLGIGDTHCLEELFFTVLFLVLLFFLI